MASVVFASRKTNISHNTDEAAAGRQDSEHFGPNLLQGIQKLVVVSYMAELPLAFVVSLQRPIWGRGQHEVNGFVFDKGQIPRVPLHQAVKGWNFVNGFRGCHSVDLQ